VLASVVDIPPGTGLVYEVYQAQETFCAQETQEEVNHAFQTKCPQVR
jgi:hypothetical protein